MMMAVMILLCHNLELSVNFVSVIRNLRVLSDDSPLTAMTVYVLATSLGCVFLAMPGAVFAVIAGILFEPFTGTVLCVIAATLGAVMAFLAGRYFLRDSVRPFMMRSELLRRLLFDDEGHSAVILLMITRLVPLFPYNLQNFAYGLTDIKILPYTVYTFVFMTPGAAAFTLGAAGIGDTEKRKLYLLLAVALAVIVLSAGFLLRRKFVRR